MQDIKKIAVIVPHRPFFGNILTQLPLFQGLRELYPDAHICVWSKTTASQLIIDNHFADELVIYKKMNLLSLFRSLKSESYQQLYNIYSGSEKMHILSYLSGIPERYGFSNSKLMKHCYHKHQQVKKGERYIALNNIGLVNHVHGTHFTPNNIQSIDNHSLKKEDYITFLPGGGAGDFKRWPIESYCKVFKAISAHYSFKGVFILGPQEQQYQSIIEDELAGYNVEFKQSPDLPTLVNIARHSKLTIANDCGPMHIFQMLAVPLITIWGWEKNISPFEVMSQWFYSTDNAWAIVPTEAARTIHAIPATKIIAVAMMQLSNHKDL